jgi:hypothetical protein
MRGSFPGHRGLVAAFNLSSGFSISNEDRTVVGSLWGANAEAGDWAKGNDRRHAQTSALLAIIEIRDF